MHSVTEKEGSMRQLNSSPCCSARGRAAQRLRVLIVGMLGLACPPALYAQSEPPDSASITAAQTKASAQQLPLQQAFDAILASKQELKHAVGTRDLRAFKTHATQMQQRLAATRLAMDREFLTGAW